MSVRRGASPTRRRMSGLVDGDDERTEECATRVTERILVFGPQSVDVVAVEVREDVWVAEALIDDVLRKSVPKLPWVPSERTTRAEVSFVCFERSNEAILPEREERVWRCPRNIDESIGPGRRGRMGAAPERVVSNRAQAVGVWRREVPAVERGSDPRRQANR